MKKDLTVKELLEYMSDIQRKPKHKTLNVEIFDDGSGQFIHHTGIIFNEFNDIEDLIELISKDENE